MITTIIAGVVGIISTVFAWSLNPKRKVYEELDDIYRQLEECYEKRDSALVANDADTLTVVTSIILRLRTRKADLLQRVGAYRER